MKQRWIAACVVALGAWTMAACTPPATGGGSTTTVPGTLVYPAAGCYKNSKTPLGDYSYTGTANTADNLVQYESHNGTCTGATTSAHDVLVVAATYSDADVQCAGLFFGTTGTTTLKAQGWTGFGPTAWYCNGT